VAKEKACRQCKTIYEGANCPRCKSAEFLDSFKGKISVLNPEESDIAKNLGLKEKGIYAIRLK